MNSAIVSGYSGDDWKAVANTTWPSMDSYAKRLGISFVGHNMPLIRRCPAWQKLVCIADALVSADQVLWLDCDVMVADESESIFSSIPDSADHAACLLRDRNGIEHYNTGVWVVRRSMFPHMITAAMDDECIHHPWWEQRAINNVIAVGAVKTHPLSEEWNFWECSSPDIRQRFRHACGIRNRELRLSFLKGDHFRPASEVM